MALAFINEPDDEGPVFLGGGGLGRLALAASSSRMARTTIAALLRAPPPPLGAAMARELAVVKNKILRCAAWQRTAGRNAEASSMLCRGRGRRGEWRAESSDNLRTHAQAAM